MNRKDYIRSILPSVGSPKEDLVEVFAPINIALIKYWGKKDRELMLPYNSSLSVTLKNLGTKTKLCLSDKDMLSINSQIVDEDSEKFNKVFQFLHLICGDDVKFRVDTENNIPIASGLASSASAFASFVLAVNALFGFNLTPEDCAKIARIGSVSAGRSLHPGFVLMNHENDSAVTNVLSKFNDFCVGFCIVSEEEKKYKSRDNMDYTVSSSVFYESWLQITKRDLQEIYPLIENGDFYQVGKIAERNALSMHASIAMLNEEDRFYLKSESLRIIKKVQTLRDNGLPVFCTVDAGPNVKLLFQYKDIASVASAFPEMNFYEKVV
jgi:diphosphomevalonate decarboxylase